MLHFIKLLPVIAISLALAPFAAQAQTAQQPSQSGYHTIVHNGADYFRDSFGG